jgi:hypothetical protein
MAAKTKAPVTGQINIDPGELDRAVKRMRAAGAELVQIRTRGRQAQMRGGNGSALAEITLDCAFAGKLDAHVPYKALRDAIAAIGKADYVVVEQDAGHLRLTRPEHKNVVAIELAAAVAVPDPRRVKEPREFVVAWGAQLAGAVEQVAGCASRNDTRPVLMCVLFESAPRTGTFTHPTVTATDSYRLMTHGLPGAQGEEPFRFTADARGMLDAVKGLGPDEGVVLLSHDADRDGWVEVRRTGEVWWVRSAPGTGAAWPQWRQYIPPEKSITIDVDRAEFAAACALALKARGGEASFTYHQPATVKVLKAGRTVGREVGVDAYFLHSIVSHLRGERFKIEYIAPQRPVKVASGDAAGVLMPIRLDGTRTAKKPAKSDVPLRIEILDDELVLRLDGWVDPTKQPTETDAEKAAGDLADVTGVAKRSARKRS